MIESRFWKEHLASITHSIRPVKNPRRWSERGVCTVERDVMIGFFVVRRMIELNKITTQTADSKVIAFGSPAKRNVTKFNKFRIDKNYDFDREEATICTASYICNQCIHAYLSYIVRDKNRNWSDLVVVSDFDRNKTLWRVPFSEIIKLFDAVSQDWPVETSMVYDSKKKDYIVSAS